MSFFSHIHDILDSIVNTTKHIFTKQNIDKAVAVGKRVADLVVIVLPYVEALANFGLAAAGKPTLDPKLTAAAESIGTTVDAIMTNADAAAKKGQLLTVAGDAGMAKLTEMLQTGHVTIGDLTLTSPADLAKIPKDQVDAAAQFAYSMWVKPALAASGV